MMPLFDLSAPLVPLTIEDRFTIFHRDNPQVYRLLLQICRRVRAQGIQRIGIGFLFERLRWLSLMETTGDPFKLNNDYRAYYARAIMREPGLEAIFETRRSGAD